MALPDESKRYFVTEYRASLAQHGSGPGVVRCSPEGQRFRFDKLMEIGDFKGKSVLDLGCGTGDLYPCLRERFVAVEYTGIDLVPEFVELGRARYPDASFYCLDVLDTPPGETYDWVLMSGVFNLPAPNCDRMLRELTAAAFRVCRLGLAFNFISSIVNFTQPEMAYHDPFEVQRYCVEQLSRKVTLHHHYRNCDVAVFVYR